MTTSERIEAQNFCYDPDFPPDVAEGLPLASAAAPSGREPSRPSAPPLRRALRAAAAALTRRDRS